MANKSKKAIGCFLALVLMAGCRPAIQPHPEPQFRIGDRVVSFMCHGVVVDRKYTTEWLYFVNNDNSSGLPCLPERYLEPED